MATVVQIHGIETLKSHWTADDRLVWRQNSDLEYRNQRNTTSDKRLKFWRSVTLAKPHPALDPYISLATTTALKTVNCWTLYHGSGHSILFGACGHQRVSVYNMWFSLTSSSVPHLFHDKSVCRWNSTGIKSHWAGPQTMVHRFFDFATLIYPRNNEIIRSHNHEIILCGLSICAKVDLEWPSTVKTHIQFIKYW